ncbi:MAG: hypothetical protein ABSG53_07855 [Thermoguttaceae bacterium]
MDDDAQGQPLEVPWEREVNTEIQRGEAWESATKQGFDVLRLFAAYLKNHKSNCVAVSNPRLFPSPFRAA